MTMEWRDGQLMDDEQLEALWRKSIERRKHTEIVNWGAFWGLLICLLSAATTIAVAWTIVQVLENWLGPMFAKVFSR